MSKIEIGLNYKSLALLLTVLVHFQSLYALGNEHFQFTKIAGASHLEINWDEKKHYDLVKNGKQTYSLVLPKASEKEFKALEQFSNNHIKKIEVKEIDIEKIQITFFLVNESIEAFDYLTAESPKLIIDFYIDEKIAETLKKEKKKKPEQNINISNIVKVEPAKIANKEGRAPTSLEILALNLDSIVEIKNDELPKSKKNGVFDGEDPYYKRFQIPKEDIKEESIIASKKNTYVKFPFLLMKYNNLAELVQYKPEFIIKDKNTKENKEAQLLLQLYRRNKDAAFIKVYNYFVKKYPNSEYDEIVKNLAAEKYLSLWLSTKKILYLNLAKEAFQYLKTKYPDSVLNERNHLLPAYAELERKNSLETIKLFQEIIKKFPYSVDFENANLAVAYSLMDLEKFKSAYDIIDALTKVQKSTRSIESEFRLGDVLLDSQKYRQARKYYLDLIQRYPVEASNVYPNAYFNLAESMFWLGDYKRSLNNFILFAKNFPAHDFNGYALNRIAELLEILGAPEVQIANTFRENIFRFENHPGADISKARMISKTMWKMKDLEFNKSMKILENIEKKSPLENISEFIVIQKSNGFQLKRDYVKAKNLLVNYYHTKPHIHNQKLFQLKISNLIVDDMHKNLEENKYIEVLKEYDENKNTWLKHSPRTDVDYLRGKAFEMAGIWNEAEKLYSNVSEQLAQIKGTKAGKEKIVNEYLPTEEQNTLRKAKVQYENNKILNSFNTLKQLDNLNELNLNEQIEYGILISNIALKKGKVELAKNNFNSILENWAGEKKYLLPVYLNLATLLRNKNEFENSNKILEKLLTEIDKKNIRPKDQMKVFTMLGDNYLSTNSTTQAIKPYKYLLDNFSDEQNDLDSIKYKLGKIYFDNNDSKKAQSVWNNITKSEFLKKISNENIEHQKWGKDYKKYIDRIPAASQFNDRSVSE